MDVRDFVTASDNLLGQFGMLFPRFTNRVRSLFDAVPVAKLEHAGHALAIAVGELTVGGRIGRHAVREIDLRKGAVGAFRRLSSGFELHRNRNNQSRIAGPELARNI